MPDTEDVDLDKDVFTTFDVASICNANITSIKNWIEEGELQAHRTPGGHYRVRRAVLEDFLNRHGMPNPFAERERNYLFAFHADESIEERLREKFGDVHEYETTSNPLYALMKLGQWRPDVAIIDTTIADFDPVAFCEAKHDVLDLRPVALVILHDRDESYSKELRKAGAEFPVERQKGEERMLEVVHQALS